MDFSLCFARQVPLLRASLCSHGGISMVWCYSAARQASALTMSCFITQYLKQNSNVIVSPLNPLLRKMHASFRRHLGALVGLLWAFLAYLDPQLNSWGSPCSLWPHRAAESCRIRAGARQDPQTWPCSHLFLKPARRQNIAANASVTQGSQIPHAMHSPQVTGLAVRKGARR